MDEKLQGTASGGARVRKVLVLGVGEAGKSTLVAALCERPLNLAVGGRTVAMDHGMLRRGNRALSLVGLPGQKRFAGVREALLTGAAGAVWVVRPASGADPESASLLTRLRLPYFVFVNYRDGESAGPPFRTPAGLTDPAAVLAGNLGRPTTETLQRLQAALWETIAGG